MGYGYRPERSHMEIHIDDGIPVPKERPNFKQHLEKLDLAQSFRVDIEYWTSLRNAASNMNKRTDKHFVVHKVKESVNPEKPEGKQAEYVRVWRKQ